MASGKSFRYLTQKAIQCLVEKIGTKGLWLFDRGGDNWPFFLFWHNLKLHFLIRISIKRNVSRNTSQHPYRLSAVVKHLNLPETILGGHKKRPLILHLGGSEIIIPQSRQKLLLIVVRGFGRQPMLLLTNDLSHTHQLRFFVASYLQRWGVEESGRFLKQIFRLEHIRPLTFRELVNLVWLTMWCFGFLAQLHFYARKTFVSLTSSVPSFTPAPTFSYYRLATALSVLLTRYGPFSKSNFFPGPNFG